MRELANDGRISRFPGKGSFVNDARPKSEFLIIRSIAEEIVERGHMHSAQVHIRRKVKGSNELTKSFNLPRGSLLFHTVIVHSENGIPIQLEDRYVNPRLMPHYLDADFRKLTPNQVLAQVASVKEADHIVEAVLADERARKLLKIGRHEPCLRVYRAASIDAGVSSIAWLTYPGTRFRLSSRYESAPRAT